MHLRKGTISEDKVFQDIGEEILKNVIFYFYIFIPNNEIITNFQSEKIIMLFDCYIN